MELWGYFYFSEVTKGNHARFPSTILVNAVSCLSKKVAFGVSSVPARQTKACFTSCMFSFLDVLFSQATDFHPSGTSSLATWMGMTTLTASLWGECLAFGLLLMPFLLFLYLILHAS